MISFVNLHLTILNNWVQNSICFSDFICCFDIPSHSRVGEGGEGGGERVDEEGVVAGSHCIWVIVIASSNLLFNNV